MLEKFRKFYAVRSSLVKAIIKIFLMLVILLIPAIIMPGISLGESVVFWNVIRINIGVIILYGGWMLLSYLASMWLIGELEIFP